MPVPLNCTTLGISKYVFPKSLTADQLRQRPDTLRRCPPIPDACEHMRCSLATKFASLLFVRGQYSRSLTLSSIVQRPCVRTLQFNIGPPDSGGEPIR